MAERSSQVAIMDIIYKNASMVVSWLGKEDGYTTTALQFMGRLASIPPKDYPNYVSLGLNHSGASHKEWEALVAFFRRPYFRRAWIVQEIVLASRILILCGSVEIPWVSYLSVPNLYQPPIRESSCWKRPGSSRPSRSKSSEQSYL